MANAFTSSGIKKGDRAAFLSKNSIEYAFMFYAGARSGVVPVPMNYRLGPTSGPSSSTTPRQKWRWLHLNILKLPMDSGRNLE
ncbi:MAG: AMP-binding protein [Dehalococcoidia bacterium]|nr:AMP-binding protein [Dehalococcoidia bacterium]